MANLTKHSTSAATQSEIGKRMMVLFASLPAQDKGIAEDLRAQGYLYALEGIELPILDEIVKDVLAGRIEGIDKRFVPTPPQLADACRKRAAIRNYEAYRRDARNIVKLPAPPPLSKAEEKRREKRVADVMKLFDEVMLNMDATPKRPA